MDVTPILAGLNEAQRSAVAAPLGNALVVAGAGSGKTRVLVHRFAWLIAAEGISPQGVLAVTFTNKAATEMRERIEALLSIPARALWVGTFHGIAHRLLRLHWREAGLPQNFQIIDADDQQRLVKRIMRALGVDDSRWSPRQAVWFINGHKDQGLRAKELAKSDDLFEVTHKQIYENYEQHCNEAGLVGFAELLLRCLECLSGNEDLLAHYQCRFGQTLVDEFQDTNGLQYQWLALLAGATGNIMAVGDEDQSIYGWRGARVENVRTFLTFSPCTQQRCPASTSEADRPMRQPHRDLPNQHLDSDALDASQYRDCLNLREPVLHRHAAASLLSSDHEHSLAFPSQCKRNPPHRPPQYASSFHNAIGCPS